jgi:hypothetical protein
LNCMEGSQNSESTDSTTGYHDYNWYPFLGEFRGTGPKSNKLKATQ